MSCDGASACTLSKAERLRSNKMIERLFDGNSLSFPVYPLRAVYAWLPAAEVPAGASILISVPKKKLKRAVHRNFVKRQIREAYRKHKSMVCPPESPQGGSALIVAFIWLEGKLRSTEEVEAKVMRLLAHIAERKP